MNESWIIIAIYAVIGILGTGVFAWSSHKKPAPIVKPTPFSTMSYDQLFDIVDTTFKRESVELLKDYRLRDVRVINDIEGDLRTLTRNTINAMSPELLAAMEMYHDEDYIIRYVTRMSREMLLEFTNTNKPKTTRTLS